MLSTINTILMAISTAALVILLYHTIRSSRQRPHDDSSETTQR